MSFKYATTSTIMIIRSILSIVDRVKDFLVAFTYYRNGDHWWFYFAISLIIISTLCVSFGGFLKTEEENYNCCDNFLLFLLGFLQVSIPVGDLIMFFGNEKYQKSRKDKQHFLEIIETTVGTIPQLYLQGYVQLYAFTDSKYNTIENLRYVSFALSFLKVFFEFAIRESSYNSSKYPGTIKTPMRIIVVFDRFFILTLRAITILIAMFCFRQFWLIVLTFGVVFRTAVYVSLQPSKSKNANSKKDEDLEDGCDLAINSILYFLKSILYFFIESSHDRLNLDTFVGTNRKAVVSNYFVSCFESIVVISVSLSVFFHKISFLKDNLVPILIITAFTLAIRAITSSYIIIKMKNIIKNNQEFIEKIYSQPLINSNEDKSIHI
ncbi:xk-related protein [Anaeramoeba flamelloides]|uniref:Xk-related protein n=1 Tax=Anaeramoeba flamelloides TaxID=1746091 RepID=A0AAV7YSI0_9EUKA|nr:xk-related protein [Anaeramoeba flamelloides]